MNPRSTRLGFIVGAMAGIGLLPIQTTASAAASEPSQTYYGRWVERDLKLPFDVRPGANDNQVVLVMPSAVNFPGSHEYRLQKVHGDHFEANGGPERPTVLIWFKSASKAELKVRGSGGNDRGNWISINDYLLVRP